MDHLNKVDILTQEIIQMTFDENDPPTESVPEELRLWWKATESCLEFIMSQPVTDSDEISTLLPLIWGVLEKVPLTLYGSKLPIVQRLIWFCDDCLTSSKLFSKDMVSKFHSELLEFRHRNENAFRGKKRHIFDHLELELEKLFDSTTAVSLEDDQLIEHWLVIDESELADQFSKQLIDCNEEKDFKKLGVILWRFFHAKYFLKSGLSEGLSAWLKTARRVIFQSNEPHLLFQILNFLPVILEQEYSLPFKIRRKKQFNELFNEAKTILRQIYFPSEFTRKFDSIIRQYWKFFFYFIRREKYPAFESLLEIFVPILEVKFQMTEGRSNCSAEMSEVYYALKTSNKLRFRECIKNALKDSVKIGSSCFADLFPSNMLSEQLDKSSLIDAVIYEAVKDGEIDLKEREILQKIFAVLELNKEETIDRINKIKLQVRADGEQSGALNPRVVMRKLLTIAFMDGDLDSSEKELLNITGKILGITKIQMQELFFVVREQSQVTGDELAMMSLLCFNPDFEIHWDVFQAENLEFEGLSRDLKILSESNQLVFDGDQVDWGEFHPVPLNVELSRMPGGEKVGIFFIVNRRGVLLLREILNLLAYVVVEEGESDSKIILQMCDGREIIIFQNEGFHFDEEIKESLKQHRGRVSLILLIQKIVKSSLILRAVVV